MATQSESAEAVRAALKDGSASDSTIRTLQNLLELGPPQAASKSKSVEAAQATGRTPKVAPGRAGRAPNRKAADRQNVAIHEDAALKLSMREQYALATEAVNASLKILSESWKAKASGKDSTNEKTKQSVISTPKLSREAHPTSQQALKARSGNATPIALSDDTKRSLARRSSHASILSSGNTSSHVAAIAECAHLAFSFLRSANPLKFGARDMPPLQLENGMLALAGKMIAHGLESMALKELRIVKRRLEASFLAQTPIMISNTKTATLVSSPEKATLVSLMRLDVSLPTNSEAMAVAISYYLHVLKIISASRKPAVIEELPHYLQIDTPNSIVHLILRQIEQGGDKAKSAKQLESLSQTILALCPSISSSADGTATDANSSPSPKTVLELQTLALQIRKLWWPLSKHKPDLSKELVEPFFKCANAYSRRTTGTSDTVAVYQCLERCVESIGPFDTANAGEDLFSIHHLLRSQAGKANLDKEAAAWAEEILRDCACLEESHVRRVICAADRLASTSKSESSSTGQSDIKLLADLLCRKLTGGSSDYDLLISSLSSVAIALEGLKIKNDNPSVIRLSGIIAGFGTRYWRSYPGMNTASVRSLLDTALRISGSIDDMLSWITEDVAKFLIQEGAMRGVARAAATKPLSIAWACSSASISLSRVLRVLLMRALHNFRASSSTMLFDIEDVDSAERGVLLEMQLVYAVDLAVKPKYHDALQRILPDLLDRLAKIYTLLAYPIRRARVAGVVFRLKERNSEILSSGQFDLWRATNLDGEIESSKDVGLLGLLQSVKVGLDIANMFSGGRPSISDLTASLKEVERIMGGCGSRTDVYKHIEDPETLIQQLTSMVSYFSMLGEDAACLAPRIILLRLVQLTRDLDAHSCSASTDLARQYLELGYSKKAGVVLVQAQSVLERQHLNTTAKLDFQLSYAEYFLAIDKLDECRSALNEAARSLLPAHDVPRDERKALEQLRALALFIQSKYLLEVGSPHESLRAAKQSVRILSSIWSGLERSDSDSKAQSIPDIDENPPQETKERTGGVSKLQLTPSDNHQAAIASEQNQKGAAFWPLVPSLCRALLHLSDVYAHHGLYNESSYYSERAVHIAASVGSSELLLRVRCHRSCLLTLADRTEEAELCIAQYDNSQPSKASQTLVQYYCTQATIREKEGSLDEALRLYMKAEDLLESLASADFLHQLERVDGNSCDLESRMALLSLSSTDSTAIDKSAPGKLRVPVKKAASRTAKSNKASKPGLPLNTNAQAPAKTDYVIGKMQADVVLRRQLVEVKCGKDVPALLDELSCESAYNVGSLQQRLLAYHRLIRRALSSLQMDVTLNVLPESTLSFPAIADATTNNENLSNATKVTLTKKKPNAKLPRRKETVEQQFVDLLHAARKFLMQGRWQSVQLCGTMQTHVESTHLLDATLLISSIPGSADAKLIQPFNEMLAIDHPRNKALEYERRAMNVDDGSLDASALLNWTDSVCYSHDGEAMTAAEFQSKFVDILPRSWTAVSMCLSEDGSELYIARYRSNQTPFVLRLPYSRNKSDGLNEDAFDYHKGKAELQEIIELSNHTCHNPGTLGVKGAKTKWWAEREDLDRRMQELLINIENIWLGGFKSILAQHRTDVSLLDVFRASFEAVLDRYLPSRQGVKDRSKSMSMHDQVLELFIGLGDDKDGVFDLDEPLADLLYFVVDMLQFQGERNAYDEIDFDSMAVDVLDALRAYHSAYTSAVEDTQHLILVLDRRLQAFPWESMSCLEEANVSRVGSLLSLREKIVAQRFAQTADPTNDVGDAHIVRRTAGTYILNPSSDLAGTQSMLEPALSKLCMKGSDSWTSLVNSEPDEAYFSSALKDSSMLLYFGHGAGCQYIRPRTIKRLERCCEVVWLMGCSSGIVQEYGKFEPCAVPLAYLLAGSTPEARSPDATGTCKAVVATLWDVTDKDIDRFSLTLGEEWGLWPTQEQPQMPSKTPKKREIRAAAPSTPQQMPKTPKTPKVVKTPATLKTPVRDRSRAPKPKNGKQSLVEAVSRSRAACYLRYLNGAAPVVYGIPVYLGD